MINEKYIERKLAELIAEEFSLDVDYLSGFIDGSLDVLYPQKMKMKYFICCWAECNSDEPINGIYEFNYDILADEQSLVKAEKEIEEKVFGDGRELKAISIAPLANQTLLQKRKQINNKPKSAADMLSM